MLLAVCFVAGLFVFACAFLYLQQDRMIFYPVRTDAALAGRWQDRRVEIATEEGAIEGWWFDKPESGSQTVLVYFGGNAENALQAGMDMVTRVDARRVFVSSYRGYGRTPGRPSEAALFSDALAVYDYVIKQPGVAADRIGVMGRSLGSGVATYVAAHRAVRGVVLVTPFDSLVGVAEAMYPLLPVRWLAKYPFRSDALAQNLHVPVLMIAGDRDTLIPARHAQRLHDVWAGPKKIHILRGAGHNDISYHAQYYPLLNGFLRSMD